ncbi:MAG: hypothetical protein KJ709_07250, partial [Nanoarchaeota archaeon]|nr:hypothetical protein [Nanoarchaeota archaeon]
MRKASRQGQGNILLLVLIMLLCILIGMFFESKWMMITGYFVRGENISSSIEYDTMFQEDENITIAFEEVPTSIRLSGTVVHDGEARVYVDNGMVSFLVMDSSLLPGRANVSRDMVEPPAPPEQPQAEHSNITVWLTYNPGTRWDSDDNGYEHDTGIIDFTVADTTFDFEAEEDGLCTRWQITSEDSEETSFICYGSERCCSFLGLEPSGDTWDEPYNCFLGRHGATESNTVEAQVVYVGSLGEVENSTWQELGATFVDPPTVTSFSYSCVDTCGGFLAQRNLRLRVDVEDAWLNISEISYTYLKEIEEGSTPEQLMAQLNLRFAGQDVIFDSLKNTTSGYQVTLIVQDKARITLSGLENATDIFALDLVEQEGEVYGSWELATPMIAIDASQAMMNITLPKSRYVDAILACTDWDFEAESCSAWQTTGTAYEQTDGTISFSSSGYAAWAGRYSDAILIVDHELSGSTVSFSLNLTNTSSWMPVEDAECSLTISDETTDIDSDGSTYSGNATISGEQVLVFSCGSPKMSRDITESLTVEAEVTVSENLTHSRIRVGEPVVWRRTIKVENVSEVRIAIPADIENITVISGSLEVEEGKITVRTEHGNRSLDDIKDGAHSNRLSRKIGELEKESETNVTGRGRLRQEIRALEREKDRITGNAVRITGFAVAEQEGTEENISDDTLEGVGFDNLTEVIIEDPPDEIEIMFETPPVGKSETELGGMRKEVVISSEYHYEDVIAW